MRQSLRPIWSIAYLLLLTALVSAQAVRPATQLQNGQFPADTAKQIEVVIQEEIARQNLPGLSFAVAVTGQLRYAKAFGQADLENAVPVKNTTVFRTASIAKPMTATAVMQLAEKGKLDLDAPIQKYCAAFPEKPWPITARLILGHLSGIRHYGKPGESTGTEHYFTITDSLKIFKDDSLLFEPGTKFNYTTFGYSVLGCAVEGASGTTYDDYMLENVFRPAGMDHTRPDDLFTIIPDRARGYLKLDALTYGQLPATTKVRVKVGALYNAMLHDTSMKVPGGGIVSTASDLVNFGLSLMNGTVVKQSALEQMWTSQQTKDGKKTNYGLGWGVGERAGLKFLSHSGGQAGTSTLLWILPEKGIVIAAMTNVDGVSLNKMLDDVATVVSDTKQGGNFRTNVAKRAATNS